MLRIVRRSEDEWSAKHTKRRGRKGRRVGGDIACLKCGWRSRLLPIHLAQDGRQIELPPKSRDQRALAAFFSFLPSFLFRWSASPLLVTGFFSLLSSPRPPSPRDTPWHPSWRRVARHEENESEARDNPV